MVTANRETGSEAGVVIAAAAQEAQAGRWTYYGTASEVAMRRGEGWFAVRTGASSNDMNGVVSFPGANITAALIEELTSWFAQAPATWLTPVPDPVLTRRLIEAGARPERTGYWSGRDMPGAVLPARTGVTIKQVLTGNDLERWLAVATECGWIENGHDREIRRRLYQSLLRPGSALTHWLALEGAEPVGFASSYVHGHVVDLCNLAVVASRRRQGIGRALVSARVAAASSRGATTIVSAPSPDGWAMQQTLGFRSVAVIPDLCFYLPT